MGKLSITREYNAPISKVWEALTTPEQILKFWAPPNMETSHASIDKLEAGGIFRYSMKSKEGHENHVVCEYEVVDEPNKLSFYETLSDADGNPVAPSHYGMPGDEIKKSLTQITLEETDGVTTLTMIVDYGDDKANEYASYGWKGMMENLATVVE